MSNDDFMIEMFGGWINPLFICGIFIVTALESEIRGWELGDKIHKLILKNGENKTIGYSKYNSSKDELEKARTRIIEIIRLERINSRG